MKLTVYTSKNCPRCKALKRWLKRNEISFITKSLDDTDVMTELVMRNRIENRMKDKPRIWNFRVSAKLDDLTRKHIAKTKYDSLAQFVRTAVRNHIKDEAQEPDGNNKSVLWIMQVPPKLDDAMRAVAISKYPSMSDLLGYAVLSQLEKEEIVVTFSRDKNKGDEKS